MSNEKRLSFGAMRAYAAVVEHNSIAEAAKVLDQTPTSVSFAVQQVEDKFRASLFIRARDHGIVATPEGKALAEQFRSLLEEYENVIDAGRSMSGDLSGTLRIGYDAPAASAFLPHILRPMVQENPKFNLELRVYDNEGVQEALLTGKIDVAIYGEHNLRQGIITHELLRFPPYILAPAGHIICKSRPAKLAKVTEHPLIVLDRPGARPYFNSLFRAQGLQPNILAYVDSAEMMRGMVGARLGLGILNIHPKSDRSNGNDPLIAVALERGLPPISLVVGRAKGQPRRLVADFVKRLQIGMQMDEMQGLIVS